MLQKHVEIKCVLRFNCWLTFSSFQLVYLVPNTVFFSYFPFADLQWYKTCIKCKMHTFHDTAFLLLGIDPRETYKAHTVIKMNREALFNVVTLSL